MYAGYRKIKDLNFLQFPKGARINGISDSSNLNLANGDKVLTEPAIYGYVMNNIVIDLPQMVNYSGVIQCETENISTLPQILLPSEDPLSINIILGGSTILDVNGIPTPISGTGIEASVTVAPMSNNTVTISDMNCDGSEDSKYLTEINITDIKSNVLTLNQQLVAFLSPNNEIIMGYLDADNGVLKYITRGGFISAPNTPNRLGVLSNNTQLTLLSLNKIYINPSNPSQVEADNHPQYWSNYEISGLNNGDKLFKPALRKWYNFDGAFYAYDYVFLGYAVCDSTHCIGCKTVDAPLNIMGLNNITLDYNETTLFTTSKRILLSCCDKIVDLDVGIIKWNESVLYDTSSILPSTTYYAYINTYGTPYLSPIRPIYWDLVNYYRHPYHYWRCLGEATTSSNGSFINIKNY